MKKTLIYVGICCEVKLLHYGEYMVGHILGLADLGDKAHTFT